MKCLTVYLLLVGNLSADSTCVDSVNRIIEHALWQTTVTKIYDPAYIRLDYPGGDLPIERGVCCDVIIRAFRAVGIDLQKEVHEDMERAFAQYPRNWGLEKPDASIDHRRVPNIMTFLQRLKKTLPATRLGPDYKPGDIVSWKIPGNLDHIGMVSNVRVDGTDRYKMVHNIGAGAKLEDVLFAYEITGHYRYFSSG
jgi:uncharacterized protein